MSMQPPLYGAPVRTRARAAAEAQQLQMANGSASSSYMVAHVVKKRKRNAGAGDVDGLAAKKVLTAAGAKLVDTTGSSHWSNGAMAQSTLADVRFY